MIFCKIHSYLFIRDLFIYGFGYPRLEMQGDMYVYAKVYA